MSSQRDAANRMLTALYGVSAEDVSKQTLLVRTITQKTREGKIVWTNTKTALSAVGPAGLEFNFVVARSGPRILRGSSDQWQLFTVRDGNGEELLKIENSDVGIPIPTLLSGAHPDSVEKAVDELFGTLQSAKNNHIADAISKIERL